jgi:hypothetical protein
MKFDALNYLARYTGQWLVLLQPVISPRVPQHVEGISWVHIKYYPPPKTLFHGLMNYPLDVSPDRYTPQPQPRSLTWKVFYDPHCACLCTAKHLQQSWKLKLGIGLFLYEEQWLVTVRLRIQAFLARAVPLSSTAERSINTAFFFPQRGLIL